MQNKKDKYNEGIFHLVFRYLAGYKKNTFLTITGIAFSVMLMFSLLQMGEMLLLQFRHMVGDYPTADFTICNYDFEKMDEIYDYLQKNHGEYTMYKYVDIGTFLTQYGNTEFVIEGIDGAWEKLFPDRKFIAGEKPEKYGEICIEKGYCDVLGKTPDEIIGEMLTLTVLDDAGKSHEMIYRVSAVVSDSNVLMDSHYFYITYETAVRDINFRQFVHDRESNGISIMLSTYSSSPEENVALMNELKEKFGDLYFYKNHYRGNEIRSRHFEEKGMLNNTAAAFLCVALLITFILALFVYVMIYINITKRIRQYGTFRCIGLSNHAMIKLMGMENMFDVCCGIVSGILMGKFMNQYVSAIILEDFLKTDMAGYFDGPFSYVITIFLTLLSVLTAFLSVYLKIRKQNPIEIRQLTDIKNKSIHEKTDRKKYSFLTDMASRNLKRSRIWTGSLFTVFTFAGVLVMVVGHMIEIIDFGSLDMRWKLADYELYSDTVSEQYITMEQVNNLKHVPGIDSVYWEKCGNDIRCLPNCGDMHKILLYVYSDNLFKKLLEQYSIQETDIINNEMALLISYEERELSCENVLLTYAGTREINKNVSVTVLVKEILYDKTGGNSFLGGMTFAPENNNYLIINEKLAEKIYSAFGDIHSLSNYTDILVDCGESIDETKLHEIFGKDIFVVNVKDVKNNDVGFLMAMGAVAAYVFLAIVVLGIMMVSCAIQINIADREKEIGMLRSIGVENLTVKKLLMEEMQIVAKRAMLFAIIISIPVNLYLEFAIYGQLKAAFLCYFAGIIFILSGCFIFTGYALKKELSEKKICDMLHCE
ncbi:MAG: ABC transporter permease [Ruminococcus flavefaciens]|nr:ABC transporter permease [Ruminococcus flavefaciens]